MEPGRYTGAEVNLSELEKHRRTAATAKGEVSYLDVGEGPIAFFVHGIFLNAHLWRRVIAALRSERRCIAVDLPAHGQTSTSPDQDLSAAGQAALLGALCEALELGEVDLVGNDTGGALCQILAVHQRERVRTLTLTNCDAHDNFPPEAFSQGLAAATGGQLAPLLVAMAQDLELARGEAGLALGYENPRALSDEVVRSYMGPFADPARARELERMVNSIDAGDLLAIEPGLEELDVPTLIVWGTGDVFFELDWAYWLRDHIPGAREVVEIEGGKLFFPDERAAELMPHLERFLGEHSPLDVSASDMARRERI
jgi:pimeloyl-ACP methyl ester carboxylesterase